MVGNLKDDLPKVNEKEVLAEWKRWNSEQKVAMQKKDKKDAKK